MRSVFVAGVSKFSKTLQTKFQVHKSGLKDVSGVRVAPQNIDNIRNQAEGWLARAQNPASRMEVKCNVVEESIKQMEHERNKSTKDIKQHELNRLVDKYAKIIMMKTTEINILDGKELKISYGKRVEIDKVKLAVKLAVTKRKKAVCSNVTEKRRDFNKPNCCNWVPRCKFSHGEPELKNYGILESRIPFFSYTLQKPVKDTKKAPFKVILQ